MPDYCTNSDKENTTENTPVCKHLLIPYKLMLSNIASKISTTDVPLLRIIFTNYLLYNTPL